MILHYCSSFNSDYRSFRNYQKATSNFAGMTLTSSNHMLRYAIFHAGVDGLKTGSSDSEEPLLSEQSKEYAFDTVLLTSIMQIKMKTPASYSHF